MRVTDLKGYEHKWGYKSRGKEKTSKGHKIARELLQELYPMYVIYEEVEMPGTRLALDFLIPTLPLAVEVQGRQHYVFVKHFHRTREKFIDQLKRDRIKAEWLELNNIPLVLLNDGEIDDWREQIITYARKDKKDGPESS